MISFTNSFIELCVNSGRYKKDFLEKYVKLGNSFLENTEKLEQLRILENGYKIRVVDTTFKTVGVDLPEHIDIIEKMIAQGEDK